LTFSTRSNLVELIYLFPIALVVDLQPRLIRPFAAASMAVVEFVVHDPGGQAV